MKTNLIIRLMLLALVLVVASPAVSEDKKPVKEAAEQAQPRFDPRIGKLLNQAIEALNAGKTVQARAALDKINLDRASPYEVSRIEQLFAAIDQSEEKYPSAREHLSKALASGGLNDKEISATRFQIAALFLSQERWAEGAKALEEWFASEPNPNSLGYYTLAVAYYQLGNIAAAVTPAQKAVDLAGDDVKDAWLQLLLAVRAQREEYSLALPVLMRLLQRGPDRKAYWTQGASISLALEKYDSATALLQLAHTADFLGEPAEIQQLAELLAYVGIPHRAARILTEAVQRKQVPESLKACELIANYWIAAREYDKAIEPLARAGELSSSGEPYLRLAEVYFQQRNWSRAATVLERAVGKGSLKHPGRAQLLMGVALFNLQKVSDSRTWFERALAYGESRKQAEEWLRNISSDKGG